jgi:tetratricopeptide (TPR) repeat protein
MRGELDWIVMKCLEKDRDRRYETANGLAHDIERHLHDEPVQACPPSAGYKLRKVARKYRTLLGTAAAFAVLLVAGAIVSAWLAVRARQAEVRVSIALEEARTQRDRAGQAVDDMYTGVAEKWLTHQPRLQKVQQEFLQKALAYYEEFAQEESNDPEARHRRGLAHKRVGDMKAKLGKHAEAEKAYQNAINVLGALAAQAKDTPEYAADLARTHYMMGVLFERVGRPAEAERAYREGLSYQEALATGPATSPERKKDLALTWRGLGELLEEAGRPNESEDAYRHALKIQQAADFPTLPDYRNDLAMTLHKLGELLEELGESHAEQQRLREAEALFRQALAITDRLEVEFPAVPAYRENLGLAANNLAALLEGSTGSERDNLWHRALSVQQRLVADFPDVPEYRWELAITRNNLGYLRLVSDQYKEAEAELLQALPIMENLVAELAHVPQNQALIAEGLLNLATAIGRQNRDAEALPLQERALSYVQSALKSYPDNPLFRNQERVTYMNLGTTRAKLGDHAAAAQAVGEGIKGNPTQEAYAKAARNLLLCASSVEKDRKLTDEERRSSVQKYTHQAIAYYRQALELASKAPGMLDGRRWNNACAPLANWYQETGRSKEAAQVWKEAVDLMKQKCAADPTSEYAWDWLATFQCKLAEEYHSLGQNDLAIETFRESTANWKKRIEVRKLAPDDPTMLYLVGRLVEAHAKAQEPREAVAVINGHLVASRKQLPAGSPQLAAVLARLGLELLELKAFSEAEPPLRECLEIRMKLAPDAWTTFNAKSMLGGALLGQKKYADAASLLLAGYQGLKRLESTSPPDAKMRCSQALTRLVQLYEATGKKEEAAKWRKELEARKAADKP